MQIDLTTFILELINFVVLVWLLHRFLYRPIQAVMARRRQAIEDSVQEAADQKQQADDLRTTYEKRLADWQREQDRERAELDKELADERERKLEEVRQAVEEEKQRLAATTAKKEADARRRMEKQARAKGMDFAAKFLERLSGAELDRRLAEVLVEDIKAWPDEKLESLKTALAETEGQMTIASPRDLPLEVKQQLEKTFSEATGVACKLSYLQDESLIAGLSVTIGPWVLQANVRDELAWFTEGLVHAQ
ncbi:F0F1 ATP synthase subunit delta [Emcibacter nanhaiensis]|uniref:ATP synthase subunit b n=1 Tax=Emcibacter nanhaiensis TaxID=1505037 RepID=A0A501PI16_9PROT|nr:F0F1 ATP synthase subunit delta [Emcibacter nanhaiensis]TPD59835.1 hypothetical protein FIV46_10130 [Emcibacter nanhaiensis]